MKVKEGRILNKRNKKVGDSESNKSQPAKYSNSSKGQQESARSLEASSQRRGKNQVGSRWSRDASLLIGCAEVSATPAQAIAARRVYDIGRVDGYDYF